MKGKKIVAILLSAAMCLSMTAVGFAATTGEADTSAGITVSEISETAEKETAVDDAVLTADESDAEILYSGTDGDLDWSIDSDGLLLISGVGDYSKHAWTKYSSYITSAIVEVSGITATNGMFFGCTRLTSIDVSGLDTSNVTDMGYMFDNCTSLMSLDVSGFDTSNV
ncbi:MAG: BspA family leucine-rich repeat surface protein, partial [Clostridiales bacterium]|nr:BspA family leucine-rich repeat surface protein [Clostridiales bacterium]